LSAISSSQLASNNPNIGLGFDFYDLYHANGLAEIDAAFLEFAKLKNIEIYTHLQQIRSDKNTLSDKEQSELIIKLAPVLEEFIGNLFVIENPIKTLQAEHNSLSALFSCKRLFVQRRAVKQYKKEEAENFIASELLAKIGLSENDFSEIQFAQLVENLLQDEVSNAHKIDACMRYAAWAVHTIAGQRKYAQGVLFKVPQSTNLDKLIPHIEIDNNGAINLPESHRRARDGFALTDDGGSLEKALDNANYCIFCHKQGKDSCSKGLKEKDSSFKVTPHNIQLSGCPLEEKISEMNLLKSEGFSVGALAVITIDNPLCAATGHRICNDCMKSCIYQKQEPVNIPQVETRTLRDVLNMPWGFEIYSLLTRWNPLNFTRWLPLPETGKSVLVAGMGPAGFNLAHHLLNDGHIVVGIDGLKIEPLPNNLAGNNFIPIKNINDLLENLDTRLNYGFGGVAEYGITVRWDKNFLKIIRILLQRRQNFSLLGGVRLGSNITIDNAFQMGFQHIALCMGAGKPNLLGIPNGLAKGVRTASDFLMALQLTGAARLNSLANLTVRLPILVIGGGLTAIDAATESKAYYFRQLEKFQQHLNALKQKGNYDSFWNNLNAEEKIIAEEFLNHASDIDNLKQQKGLVKVVYRSALEKSPAYRLNHEEVEKALEEGIEFLPNMTPLEFLTDEYGYINSATFRNENAEIITLSARTILIAAGTSPNTIIAGEYGNNITMSGKYFRTVSIDGNEIKVVERNVKQADNSIVTTINPDGTSISFLGDMHPAFAGNVVKAMASAKQCYPQITALLRRTLERRKASEFIAAVTNELSAHVVQVNRLTPTIVEVIIKSPQAARNFKPGQFFRLQNFESTAPKSEEYSHAMEGLAMTGAWVDVNKGLVSIIALEMGGSSNFCVNLKPGEPVILMGPTGAATEIGDNETILLAGGGLGNAVLFSIGKAMRASNNKVIYFAGYKNNRDRFKLDDIEAAADIVIWCCDETPDFAPRRPQDCVFHGNIVQAIEAYNNADLPLNKVSRIIAIGSDRMMAAVQAARSAQLKPKLPQQHIAIGSINSPMQCMMKEICAQCLQRHIDPVTGLETYVFTCTNQDQDLDKVDFRHLRLRLEQNSMQEKLISSVLKQNSCN